MKHDYIRLLNNPSENGTWNNLSTVTWLYDIRDHVNGHSSKQLRITAGIMRNRDGTKHKQWIPF